MASPSEELVTLYDAHAQALFGFVLNLTRSEADTFDVVQEVFCRLAQNPRLLDGVSNPRAYLLRMAYSFVVDASRRRRTRDAHRETLGPENLFQPAEDPDTQAYREAVGAALAELPEEQRAVVHLKLWEQMTFEQIAAALKISPNTAASRYRYGIDKLRTLLRPLYEEIQ